VGQLSAPIRVFGLVAVLAAMAMGAYIMTAGRGGGAESVDNSALAPLKAIKPAQQVASKLSAHNNATAAGKPAAAAPAPARPAAKAKVAPATPNAPPARAAAKPKPAVKLAKGTPRTIAGQLAAHEVVIVLLYDPHARVDDYSLAETQLGAKDAGAGFLAVDVMDQHQASPFTTAYGVLQDPTVLFFKRPGKLALKLVGYADHDTIAQAAKNAALGLGTVATS
jgi:hypothetical protein